MAWGVRVLREVRVDQGRGVDGNEWIVVIMCSTESDLCGRRLFSRTGDVFWFVDEVDF